MTRSSLPADQNKLHQSYLFERVIQNGPKEEYQGSPGAGDAAIPFEIKAAGGVDKPNRMHFPTSIDTLSPNNRFVRALNNLPIAHHIPYHSIMGDRGRGDTPNSSDGVVAYSSSHLDGAQSERIVSSDHGAHQNMEGIEEVHRILLLNPRQRHRAVSFKNV
jgi:hypothetical protein